MTEIAELERQHGAGIVDATLLTPVDLLLALRDPQVVWSAMLRGDIAMPELVRSADSRFGELARRVEELLAENTRLVNERRKAEEALVIVKAKIAKAEADAAVLEDLLAKSGGTDPLAWASDLLATLRGIRLGWLG